MTNERWEFLSNTLTASLTPEEIRKGWHFCYEFDGLLIGPGCPELHYCSCLPVDHQVYYTKPSIPK